MKKQILLVEDEAAIRQMIRMSLERENYQIVDVETAKQARAQVAEQLPDLILLDWMLPDLSGPELIRLFRQEKLTHTIPIIMLTARAEEDDMVRGLDAGADDYLPKPVSLKNLNARIKALLRRSMDFNEQEILDCGRLKLNLAAHQLKIDDAIIHLGATEFRLLAFFMKRPGKVYSRTLLLDSIWGQNSFIEERTVDVHILRLRKQLKKHQADHYIKTVRSVGYLFDIQPEN